MNWGLILLGVVIVGLQSVLVYRGFSRGKTSIGSQSYLRDDHPRLYWTGTLLNVIWLCAGIWALKVGLEL